VQTPKLVDITTNGVEMMMGMSLAQEQKQQRLRHLPKRLF
jgi:hypothetical protein